MTEIPDHLLNRARKARTMTKPALTIDELRELRSMASKTIEAHDVLLDRLGYGTGAMSRHTNSLEDLLTYVNTRIGELS